MKKNGKKKISRLKSRKKLPKLKRDKPTLSSETETNAKQELFCQYYATDREFFGNGVASYIESYDPDTSRPNWYKSACSSASQLLSNIKVCKRINELLTAEGLCDEFVDKQLLMVITQHDDKGAKVAAIKEYNKLKSRIIEKIDHTTRGKPLPTPIYGGRSSV